MFQKGQFLGLFCKEIGNIRNYLRLFNGYAALAYTHALRRGHILFISMVNIFLGGETCPSYSCRSCSATSIISLLRDS